MSERIKKVSRYLCMFLCMVLLAGCGSDVSEGLPQLPEEVEEAMKEDAAEKEGDAEPLQEENDIPEDGIITEAQMATIVNTDKTYHFNGKTEEGISYCWTYDGKKIQNPQEQRLLVEVTDKGLDEVKKAANDAPYALAVTLQKMNMAAPAELTLVLDEKWDADKVLYCTYEDGKLYKLSDVQIAEAESEEKESSVLTFPVSKVGTTLYLVGGSTKGSGEEGEQADASGKKEQTSDSNGETAQAEPVAEEPLIEELQETGQSEEERHTCTFSIECSTILNNWEDLKSSKAEFVPADGWILSPTEVEYTPGETVFDVLKRVCSDGGIQMESSYTPAYGSYYIEGINQLYEFDCGQQSGWMYSVNGWFPNYGCSSYTVEDNDVIEWRYTCTLGSDVGDQYYE